MRLFRRRGDETLNEQLLREAGYTAEGTYTGEVAHDDRETEPEQPEAEPIDEAPQWDATVSVVDPDLEGDEYGFVVLADGDFELAASRIDDTLFEATVTPL